MRVAVLKGGRSLERQISLRSGQRVEGALARLGHEPIGVDTGRDLIERLRALDPDVVFIALHGLDGEDGTMQELLEVVGLTYTGSSVLGCVRAADKVLAKHLLREAGLPTPEWVSFTQTAFRELGATDALEAVPRRLGFPLVVKPSSQGSALGIKRAGAQSELPPALVAAFSYDGRVLLERQIVGRDLAVSVIDGPEGPTALPVVEAVPRGGTGYDFGARYEIGRTEFICPADLPEEVTERARALAVDVHRLLGLYGFSRVDLMLDETSALFVLEANAVPGMTETSLLPLAAEAAGVSFDDIVASVLRCAVQADRPAPAGSSQPS